MAACKVVVRMSGVAVLLAVTSLEPVFAEDRNIDGTGNNLQHPDWGAAFTMLMRMGPVMYEDGVSEPAGADRPNPRDISNAVCAQDGLRANDRRLSDWIWQWGQFLDHDITLSEFMLPEEPFPVMVPAGDPWFDPSGRGGMMIELNRSVYDPQTGTGPDNPRQQVNQLTAFIDGSGVYGSDPERAAWLRSGIGGMLKTGPGNLLPFNDGTQVNAGPGGLPSFDTGLFTAGDIRSNEQSGLTAIHTLWLREHNRLCAELAAEHPDWDDEQLYQRARKIVGALIQVITYHEFLPAVLGPHAPDPREAVYDPELEPKIFNEFANASYRVGHTMLSPQIRRLQDDGSAHPAGDLPLREAFFNPGHILEDGGIEPLLLGLASQNMQEIDPLIIDDVRNFLFGPPGAGGFDLASLNIQRGRDHGLPDYNMLRESFGLQRVDSFADITADPEFQSRLSAVYPDVDDIDPWVGGLAEDHLPGASVGELLATVLRAQFTHLRDGDRLFYRLDGDFSDEDIRMLEQTRLADVIRRNTSLSSIQDDVFTFVPGDDGEPPALLCGIFPLMNAGVLLLGLGLLRFRALGGRRRPV